eukprot:gene40809-22034_t
MVGRPGLPGWSGRDGVPWCREREDDWEEVGGEDEGDEEWGEEEVMEEEEGEEEPEDGQHPAEWTPGTVVCLSRGAYVIDAPHSADAASAAGAPPPTAAWRARALP